ncbi:MAG: hypothetical protein KDJ16_17340, partial [Hyphomicrobiales bacterium]|nr:hypothetical protein [Hyphomicrobiales bacterium]
MEIVSDNRDTAGRDFIRALRNCASQSSAPVTIGVLGFDRGFTELSDSERVEMRRIVEGLVGRQRGVTLKPIADLDKLVAGRIMSGGHDAADVMGILAEARDVTAVIHFEGRRIAADRFELRLVGTTRAGDCLMAGAVKPLVLALGTGTGFHDLKKLIAEKFAGAILDQATVAAVVVRRFVPEGDTPYNRCTDAVGEAVTAALSAALSDPNLALQSRSFSIRTAAADAIVDDPTAAVLSGRFGSDRTGLWVSAELANAADGTRLVSLERTYVTGLACEPRALSFLEAVAAAALSDPSRLSVVPVRSEVRPGEVISFKISGGRVQSLYCWVLAADRTGFVLLPTPGATARIGTNETLVFPTDFGFPPIVSEEPSENIFGCFGTAADLSEPARAAWAAKYGAVGQAAGGALDETEIWALAATMRRQSDIVEAYGKVTIRR